MKTASTSARRTSTAHPRGDRCRRLGGEREVRFVAHGKLAHARKDVAVPHEQIAQQQWRDSCPRAWAARWKAKVVSLSGRTRSIGSITYTNRMRISRPQPSVPLMPARAARRGKTTVPKPAFVRVAVTLLDVARRFRGSAAAYPPSAEGRRVRRSHRSLRRHARRARRDGGGRKRRRRCGGRGARAWGRESVGERDRWRRLRAGLHRQGQKVTALDFRETAPASSIPPRSSGLRRSHDPRRKIASAGRAAAARGSRASPRGSSCCRVGSESGRSPMPRRRPPRSRRTASTSVMQPRVRDRRCLKARMCDLTFTLGVLPARR